MRRRSLSLRGITAILSAGLILLGNLALARAQPELASDDTVKVDAGTEAVINGALKYLAAQQLPNGSWTGDKDSPASNKWAVAMTSYVMMAFMANGNLPDAGPYAKQVKNGLQFLLDSVQADGTFQEGDRAHYMYSHGLGTMVLAELYGETQNPAIRPKLEHVVLLIIHGQNPEGGWRYQPGSKDADISVTVPQTVALCAAKRAGIAVPQTTIDRAVAYIKRCALGTTGGFSYQVGKPGSTFARAAAAIYALQITGLYDDPLVADGSSYIMKNFIMSCNSPGWQTSYLTYGSYYAGVGHYLMGGDKWKSYYQTFGQQYLLQHVSTQGDMSYWNASMDPNAKGVGSNWCTAVFTTILSLPYGYLPLYQR
ncbi:MAG: terpene cyclase/mutase family protein [Methylacidiphilales bacterium]|nr:terpene cyclase/mutase family protein [Candidatus Methylacidiphilales bacterium]